MILHGTSYRKDTLFLFSAKISHLILYIGIAQLQTDEVLEWLEEHLVEVEIGQLRGVLQEGGNNVVDVLHRLLGDHVLLVAGRLWEINKRYT